MQCSTFGQQEACHMMLVWLVITLEALLIWTSSHVPVACICLQVNGQVVIESFQGFSLINMVRLQSIPQKIMNKLFKFQQDCLPFRLG